MKRIFLILAITCLLISSCKSNPTTPTIQSQEPLKPTTIPVTPTTLPSDTPQPSPTPIPPTETPLPPTFTPTAVPPTDTQPPPTEDIQAAIDSANIILFEDMFFSRYVKKALDQGGYTYTDVADRLGTFQQELLSNTKWDLIIAAAEGRGGVAGEFFDYINQQLENGASVILEIWILDSVAGGRIQPILDRCGIDYQANWVNPSNRGVYWVDESNPFATEPNTVSPTRFGNYWDGDVGDLVYLTPGSESQILASANEPNPNRDGLITLCGDGRLLLQTFSTHDHPEDTMVDLWENYIYNMLSIRFK
jgi:hypothetical protein